MNVHTVPERAQSAWIRNMIKNMNDPALLLCQNEQNIHSIIDFNSAFEALCQQDKEVFQEKTFEQLFLSTARQYTLNKTQNYWYTTPTNQTLRIQANFIPLDYSDQPSTEQPAVFLVLLRDITQSLHSEHHANLLQYLRSALLKGSLKQSVLQFLNHIANTGNYTHTSLWWGARDQKSVTAFRCLGQTGPTSKALLDREEELLLHFSAHRSEPFFTQDNTHSLYALPLEVADEVRGILFLATSPPLPSVHFEGYTRTLGQMLGVKIERKYLHQELLDVLHHSPDAMCVSQKDGYLNQCNPAMHGLIGSTLNEIQNLVTLIHPEDRPLFKKCLRTLDSHAPQELQCRCFNAEGKVLYVKWKMTLAPAHERVYHLVQDITQKHSLSERLDLVYDLSRIGSWEMDLNTHTIFWSKITREIHEIEDPTFTPKLENGVAFYHPEDRNTIQAAVQCCIDSGQTWDLQLRIITAKGNIRWIRTLGEGEFKQGKCQRLLGMFMDIHAQKSLELEQAKQAQSLAALNRFHKHALESHSWQKAFDDICQQLCPIHGLLFINYLPSDTENLPAAGDSSTNSYSELPMQALFETNIMGPTILRSDTLPSASTLRTAMEAKDISALLVYPVQTDQQSGLLILARSGPHQPWTVPDIAFFENFSHHLSQVINNQNAKENMASLNQQLEQHIQILADTNQELEQFVRIASHDLQEPLRMVTCFLERLEDKYTAILDDKARRYIHFAIDGAQRMRQVIYDLLEYSRQGKDQIRFETVDLNVLLKEILFLLQEKVRETGAQISYPELPSLRIPRLPVQQLLQNLIENALKYSDPQRPPQIEIELKEHKHHWQFSVRDNGIGINPEYFDKIFIIFQRLHVREKYGGTGVGLALCKKIVEQCQGKIWVKSKLDEGSTFFFQIPKGDNL